MYAETATSTAQAAPCTATGGERTFSGACRTCPAFAIGCIPARPTGSADSRQVTPVIPAEDLQALQRDSAGSPCIATGEARAFSGACRTCPAFGLWCSPSQPQGASRAEAVA